MKLIILLGLLFSYSVHAQNNAAAAFEEDFELGGDIFTDFSEDLTTADMAEDERYYRYGRFFSFQMGMGTTFYDGNRGAAYLNDPPTIGFQVNYFMNFRVSVGMGFTLSRHHFFIDGPTAGFPVNAPGLIQVDALRTYFGYRYYIDTANLGTAITYSNPYFTGRMDYWYITNKFEDQSNLDDDTGGGIGFAVGGGFEFPIEIKKTYIGVEFLFHGVNFHDKFTQKFRAINGSVQAFDDLNGNAYSTVMYYVLNW